MGKLPKRNFGVVHCEMSKDNANVPMDAIVVFATWEPNVRRLVGSLEYLNTK